MDNCSPGQYGAEIPDFQIDPADIWVDIKNEGLSFRRDTLSFGARLGSSREEDGVDADFTLTVSGEGTFKFEGGGKIRVQHLDLFDGKVKRSFPTPLRPQA